MISFFRKIRQKLLKENRVTRYLIYAVGEIILVVIGILIALQINTWNQQRLDRNFEVTMLNEIKIALESDYQLYEGLKFRLASKSESIQEMLSMIKSDRTYPDSVLLDVYNRMTFGNIFMYNKGGYEAIKSVGLDKITNDSLRKELTLLYEVEYPQIESFYKSLIDENPSNKDYKLKLHDQLWERVQIQQADGSHKIVSQPIDRTNFLKQRQLLDRVKIEQDNLNYTLIRLPQIEYIIRSRIEMINRELGLN